MPSRTPRPLYVMAKPCPAVARGIWRHPRTDKRRPARLIHATLAKLGDVAGSRPGTLDDLVAIMARFEAPPFRVVFDVIDEWRVVALRGSETMRGARAFQRELAAFLRRNGIVGAGLPPKVHITLSYHADGLGAAAIDPLSWLVDEVLLIESVVGETRHVVHGRWPLRHAN